MPDTVSITKTYQDDHWIVSAHIISDPGNVLPQSSFIYENTGTTTLGSYIGVCNLSELQRLQVWQGVALPKFGNRFVRHDVVETHLTAGATPDRTVSLIQQGLSNLKAQILNSASETVTVTIA